MYLLVSLTENTLQEIMCCFILKISDEQPRSFYMGNIIQRTVYNGLKLYFLFHWKTFKLNNYSHERNHDLWDKNPFLISREKNKAIHESRKHPVSWGPGLGPVSRKRRKLFRPAKLFISSLSKNGNVYRTRLEDVIFLYDGNVCSYSECVNKTAL